VAHHAPQCKEGQGRDPRHYGCLWLAWPQGYDARARALNQLESARKVIVRALGKTGKMWLRVFPDKPFTQKPPEVKLGKGKGDPVGYEVEVWPGRVLFEVDGVDEQLRLLRSQGRQEASA
jgi:ribosomal protein L16